MALGKYGIILKKYLKKYKPIKYSKLIIDCSLMDYLYKKEKELIEYKAFIEKQLKQTYPEPKTNEFIVMVRYNNMIESMVEEYVLNIIKTM
ncbi:MAG: TnpV protein [Clostridia bacterium]|nr:TnpV protein [Clostridia bacterium]